MASKSAGQAGHRDGSAGRSRSGCMAALDAERFLDDLLRRSPTEATANGA